jgi:hypothetical protein
MVRGSLANAGYPRAMGDGRWGLLLLGWIVLACHAPSTSRRIYVLPSACSMCHV